MATTTQWSYFVVSPIWFLRQKYIKHGEAFLHYIAAHGLSFTDNTITLVEEDAIYIATERVDGTVFVTSNGQELDLLPFPQNRRETNREHALLILEGVVYCVCEDSDTW